MKSTVALLITLSLLCGCATRRVPPAATTAEGIQTRTGKPVQPRTGLKTSMPPGVNLEQPLLADDAAGIALWNNQQLRAELASLGIAEADLVDAGLLRNPRLDMLIPVGAKPFEMLLTLPLEVFWQRSKRIVASQAALDQLAQSLIQNGLNTARDARIAHAEAIQASERVTVSKQTLDLRERISQLTEARFRLGDISELDTVAARVEAGSAREQLARFEHEVELTLERLRLVLGLSVERTPVRVSALPPQTTPPPPLDALLEKAMASRPDLRAAELAIATAAKKGKWERSRWLVLSAQLSSKKVGDRGILTGPGFSTELPVFNRNQGLIARADAEVEVASKQYLALKQKVATEVAEARRQMLQAQESFQKTSDDVLPPLQRAIALAEVQYKKGEAAYLFFLEQSRGLVDAQLRVIDYKTAIRRAQAQLERSVGSR